MLICIANAEGALIVMSSLPMVKIRLTAVEGATDLTCEQRGTLSTGYSSVIP
jgi:hypothetical protein